MVVKLKMRTADKFFDKVCIKTLEMSFVQYVVYNQRRGAIRHEGKENDSKYLMEWVRLSSKGRFKI